MRDGLRAGHAKVAGESGFVPAAEQYGEAAGVEHFGNQAARALLPCLQRALLHDDVAGVEHVPVEAKSQRTQGLADRLRGGRGANPALVAPHAFVTAEAHDDGGPGARLRRAGDGRIGSVGRHGLPPAAVLIAVAVEAANPPRRADISGRADIGNSGGNLHGYSSAHDSAGKYRLQAEGVRYSGKSPI